MKYTREGLELTHKQDGFPGLREVGKLFNVKSTSAQTMISKILEAQNDVPTPSDSKSAVEFSGMEGLTARARNLEVDLSDEGSFFPPLVTTDKHDALKEAILSFCHRWNFDRIEFFGKFQAFRLYSKGQHVDWIGLNELSRRFDLGIPVAARTASKKLYTAPLKRAYK